MFGPDPECGAIVACIYLGRVRSPGRGPPGVFGPDGTVRLGVPSFEGPGEANLRAGVNGLFSLLADTIDECSGVRISSISSALVLERRISERVEEEAIEAGVPVLEAMIASTRSAEEGAIDMREPGNEGSLSRGASSISTEVRWTSHVSLDY